MNRQTTFSSSTATTSAAAKALLGRTVHVKVKPRPRSLAESQQILHVLRRYGEISVFKHLKVYHPIQSTTIHDIVPLLVFPMLHSSYRGAAIAPPVPSTQL